MIEYSSFVGTFFFKKNKKNAPSVSNFDITSNYSSNLYNLDRHALYMMSASSLKLMKE